MSADGELLLIIDGHNLYIRNFVVNPTLDINGERVGGVVGMMQSLGKLLSDFSPSQCVVVWDGEGGSAKRRSVYSEYKAGRRVRLNGEDFGSDAKNDLDNMHRQRSLVSDLLSSLGIPQVRCADVEADDLIAYISAHLHTGQSMIVSTDKDFLQLIEERRIRVHSPIKKKTYDADSFLVEFGILPQNYAIMKSLVGDGSDNIDGIDGFGIKTVAKAFPFLAERISSLDEVIVSASESKMKACKNLVEDIDKAKLNMKLMDLIDPKISANATRDARAATSALNMPVKEIEFRLRLRREGISLTNERFLQPYRELVVRRKRTKVEGVG